MRQHTTTTTIGRNIGARPMSDKGWRTFATLVGEALADELKPDLLFEYKGDGEWEGVSEESIQLATVRSRPLSFLEYKAINERLARIGAIFGQDTIAFSVGESVLIEGGAR